MIKRHGLKQRLREAVRGDSLQVHYQPIVELDPGAGLPGGQRWPSDDGCAPNAGAHPLTGGSPQGAAM